MRNVALLLLILGLIPIISSHVFMVTVRVLTNSEQIPHAWSNIVGAVLVSVAFVAQVRKW